MKKKSKKLITPWKILATSKALLQRASTDDDIKRNILRSVVVDANQRTDAFC